MKGLIVGGNQFTTRVIAKRFGYEKMELVWLDKQATAMKDDVVNAVHCIGLDYADEKCDAVFKNHKPELIVFVGQSSQVAIDAMGPSDMNHHVNGLMHIMSLAVEYQTQKFIYISTTDLYKEGIQQDEQAPIRVKDAWTMGHAMAENYLNRVDQLYDINILILRMSTVYGATQEKLDSPVSFFIHNENTKQDRKIAEWIKRQSYDLLSANDFVEAIFNAAYSPTTGTVNICLGKLYSATDIQRYILHVQHQTYGETLQSISDSFDTNHAAQLFDFTAKVFPSKGLASLVKREKNRTSSKRKHIRSDEKRSLKEKIKRTQFNMPMIIQTIENIVLFALVAYLVIIKQYTMIFDWIDIRLLYILFMSVQFGLKQSAISSALCILLVIYEYTLYKQNLLTFIYNTSNMIAIFMFVFSGVILGYVVDRRKNYIEELEKRQKNLEGQLTHTKIMYTESLRIKDALQQQIYGADDSFGKIYNIVSKLDSLAVEELNGSIINVTEEVMKTDAVSLYYVGKNNQYLRLISHSSSLNDLPTSIKLNESDPLYQVLTTHQGYVNKSIGEEHPYLMVAPIIDTQQVIALLILHKTPLKYLTLQYENIFYLTARLINQSIALAYTYQNAIIEERYIEDTLVLKQGYFEELLMQKRSQEKMGSSRYSLLKLLETDYMKITRVVGRMIREFDYIGVGKDGNVYVLLSNTTNESELIVISRFNQNGVIAKQCDERIAG